MSGQHPRKATSCATNQPPPPLHPSVMQATNTYLQGMCAVVMTAVALVSVIVVVGLVVGCLLSGNVLATASASASATGELSHVRACVCVCVTSCLRATMWQN